MLLNFKMLSISCSFRLEAESIPVLKILGSLKALDDQIAAYHSDILVLKARVADLVQVNNSDFSVI